MISTLKWTHENHENEHFISFVRLVVNSELRAKTYRNRQRDEYQRVWNEYHRQYVLHNNVLLHDKQNVKKKTIIGVHVIDFMVALYPSRSTQK